MAIALPKYLNYGQPINKSNPLNTGLLTRWQVVPYYSSGNRFIDLAGKNHGTLTNGATWQGAMGRPGGFGSLLFDGTDDYIAGQPLFSHLTQGALSFGCWVFGGTGTGFYGGVLVLHSAGAGLYRNASADGAYFAMLTDGGGFSSANVNGGIVFDDRWHFVAGTYNGATMALYVDGLSVNSTAITGNSYSDMFRAGYASGGLSGAVDGVFGYNRALSAAEVKAIYNASRSRYDPTLNWYSHPIMMDTAAAAATGTGNLLLLGVGA